MRGQIVRILLVWQDARVCHDGITVGTPFNGTLLSWMWHNGIIPSLKEFPL